MTLLRHATCLMLSYRVAQYNNDYQAERREREWREADEEERRQRDERWRLDRERWAAEAASRKAQLADKLEADGVACTMLSRPQMTKLTSWPGYARCCAMRARGLIWITWSHGRRSLQHTRCLELPMVCMSVSQCEHSS